MNIAIRHIIGYMVGATVFILLIPFALYELHRMESDYLNIVFVDSVILRILLALPIFIIGMFFVIWSNIYLFKIGKGGPAEGFGVSISPKTKKLVTIGPYRYSRNPMVFGAFTSYISIGIFLNSILCLISLFVLLFIGIVYLKFSEEKRLIKDFGKEYLDYRKRVSMIFPMRRIRKSN